MDSQRSHRKQIRHHHDPGHCHELTFSCYQRRPLLTNDLWRTQLCQAIDRAIERHNWALSAFVLMPEHVHLLVYPLCPEATIDSLLFAIKRPYSYRIKQQLTLARSPLLDKLTVHQRPGVHTFRYWQEGPGYDRNLMSESAVLAAIDYIHLNPVRRGLCKKIDDWKWSSARWYLSEGECVDPHWPRLTHLPGEFFAGRDNVTSW